jgi:hypothetical protein
MTLNHKIHSHLRALYTHLLEILTFLYTRTKLWNQAHNRHRLSPFQHRLILSEKVLPIRREVRRLFQEEEDETWAARVSEYTMQGNLFALLQAKNENIT